jgi:uncharacterized protein (TIRG00374 family)
MTVGSRWWVVGQAIVTIVLLTILAGRLDLAALRALFVRLPVDFYLGSLAVVIAGQIAYAWRWRLLLTAAGVHAPFPLVVRQYFIGVFVNNFLPSTVGGDVAKVYYVGQEHGFRQVAASVAMDRALGVSLLAILAAGALAVIPVSAARLTVALVACVAVAMLALGFLVLTRVGTGGLPARVTWLGVRAVAIAERLQRLRLDMAAPLNRPAIIIQAAVIVAGYAMALTVVYERFVTLQNGAAPPFLAIFAVVTATAVLSNIPVSLNGLGLREQLHATLLAPLGIPAEVAVAISLLIYVHLVVASLIGLACWLQAR